MHHCQMPTFLQSILPSYNVISCSLCYFFSMPKFTDCDLKKKNGERGVSFAPCLPQRFICQWGLNSHLLILPFHFVGSQTNIYIYMQLNIVSGAMILWFYCIFFSRVHITEHCVLLSPKAGFLVGLTFI